MDKVRVAVIGCGCISPMHLDSATGLNDSELVAVCDIVEERAKEASQKYNAKYYTDYREMFDKEMLDVVHICLPHYLHTAVARDALNAGINVLSEKPMSIDYDDAVKTVELAEKKKLLYGVIFQSRYHEATRLVKKRVAEGKLGKVISARAVLSWCRTAEYYASAPWRGTWEKEGGGVVINQAIHTLDLANWMIDDIPCSINVTLTNKNHPEIEVEDCADGLIKYENGASLIFYFTNNYAENEPIEIRLMCENGTVRFSYSEATITYNNGEVETADMNTASLIDYSGGKDYWGAQHAAQINQFYQAVLKREPLEISARDALKIQKLVCDIYGERKLNN